ncbi:MAG TPA: tetratricopeptide repeat protein [Bryobacteraceae bacterium]|nr:tetratricopeptide repeat protein [Bryobacteraceae bacterium]
MRRLALAGLWFALVPAGLFAEEGYVDSAICATCHARQWETYRHTGMARSFYKPAPSNQVEDYSKNNTYYHKASATYYSMTVRDGHYYQAQYQIGFDGKQTGYYEKEIDYIVGSGNHTRTYLTRGANNSLIELPLAWYAEKGGYWAMNPGYDRPDHEGLRRHIEYNCMFCHNAYPDMTGVAAEVTGYAVFPAKLPEGIDCQRCHGPGQAHVESAQNRRGTIVNPARLAPERQAEVCEQCHLETTSFPLPNSLIRYDRGPFSYRPGQPIADFKLDFDHAPGTGHEDDFEIASSAYQLNKSLCVLKSAAGKLICTTCHNPHDIQHGVQAEASYNAVCRNCHAGTEHVSTGDCVSCHMPKRRPDDVVHVVMTDHRIQRNKPARDLLADLAERRDLYRGEVVPYRPLTKPDDELYLATAQVIESSNLGAGIPRLAAAIRNLKPEGPEHHVALADALRTAGRCQEALPVYEDALRRSPGAVDVIQKMALCKPSSDLLRPAVGKAPRNAKLWTQLGLALVGEGKTADGVAAFEKATAIDPDLSEAWNDLGGVWMESGDRARAENAFLSALRVEPNYAEAHNNLANLLSGANRFDEARYHFEAALRYKPDYAFARYSYGLALGRAGRFDEARTQLERSLKDEPTAETQEALGMVFAAQGDSAHAIEHYREAVRLKPAFDRANLSLGDALITAGKASEAAPYLQQAARSKDPAVRAEAQRLLDRR